MGKGTVSKTGHKSYLVLSVPEVGLAIVIQGIRI